MLSEGWNPDLHASLRVDRSNKFRIISLVMRAPQLTLSVTSLIFPGQTALPDRLSYGPGKQVQVPTSGKAVVLTLPNVATLMPW